MEPAPACILVVDDDPSTGELVQDLLADEGYRVEYAPDGATGWARIEAGDVELVLLDLRLPDMDGLELCRRLRARSDGDTIPVIMVTATAEEEQRRAALDTGADSYITKPFNVDDLLTRVRDYVQ